MRSGRCFFRWALVLGMAAVGPAAAQAQPWYGSRFGPAPPGAFGYPAVGVGTYVGAGGPRTFVGFGFGFFPGAYSSSWGNGYSLYGPPVPTYGPIPGAFGGSDQRLSAGNPWYPRHDPFYPMPRGSRPGVLYAVPTEPFRADERLGPRPLPPELEGAEPAPQPRKQPGAAEEAPPRPAPGAVPIQFEVQLPFDDAELVFDNHPTRQTGRTRLFTTPPLTPGQTYAYEVTMRFKIEGRPQSETRRVAAAPGQRVRVDFTLPDPTAR